jgi:hypothetical protein
MASMPPINDRVMSRQYCQIARDPVGMAGDKPTYRTNSHLWAK